MKEDAIFLLARLAEFANEVDLDDHAVRIWVGHVEPAIARLRRAVFASVAQDIDPRAEIERLQESVRSRTSLLDRQLARALASVHHRAPQATDPRDAEIVEAVRRMKRTAEMSAEIMRDRQRTGAWDGAEKVARQFDRLAERASDVFTALSSAGRLVEGGWQPIKTAPKDDTIFLACTADGRQMIFRGSILSSMMRLDTPQQLQFPATHWRMLPALPSSAPHPAPDATDPNLRDKVWSALAKVSQCEIEWCLYKEPSSCVCQRRSDAVLACIVATDWKARCEAAEKMLAQWAREAPEMTREIEEISDVFQAKVDKVVAQRNAAQAENEKLRALLRDARHYVKQGTFSPSALEEYREKARRFLDELDAALSPPPLSPEK